MLSACDTCQVEMATAPQAWSGCGPLLGETDAHHVLGRLASRRYSRSNLPAWTFGPSWA